MMPDECTALAQQTIGQLDRFFSRGALLAGTPNNQLQTPIAGFMTVAGLATETASAEHKRSFAARRWNAQLLRKPAHIHIHGAAKVATKFGLVGSFAANRTGALAFAAGSSFQRHVSESVLSFMLHS